MPMRPTNSPGTRWEHWVNAHRHHDLRYMVLTFSFRRGIHAARSTRLEHTVR